MNKYQVKPGQEIILSDWDPGDRSAFVGDKDVAEERLGALNRELEELQELLYAESKHKVLIVLQGMDTSGKDGVIRHVFEGVNPQGVRVASFKVPSPDELAHDYLWRVHKQVPGKGEMVIFNRSHYEDVLVVRVHELVPEPVWKKRFDQINDFERILSREGTTILKFFLHIDLDEQKARLQARLDDPSKQWKFNPGDINERKLWPEYTKAYEDVLNKTSTTWAPWYIVPANRKWYRNLVIATVLVETLKGLQMSYPLPKEDLSGLVIE
ncbi:MAG: polyphosphate kinase [Chloroflexi bacterium RBG_16_57_11]|nr:MAG: polyphosphate kinase [Chloroflexi bacterium RBG_16_57_11]